jgi:hypothetical protein
MTHQAWPTGTYDLDHMPHLLTISHRHHQPHCLLLPLLPLALLMVPLLLLLLLLLLVLMMAGLLLAKTATLRCPSTTAQGFDTRSCSNLQTSNPSNQQQSDAQPLLPLLLPPCSPSPGRLKTLRTGGCPGDRTRDLSLTAQGAQLRVLQG